MMLADYYATIYTPAPDRELDLAEAVHGPPPYDVCPVCRGRLRVADVDGQVSWCPACVGGETS